MKVSTLGGLLLALSTSVHATDEVIPLRYVDSVDVNASGVILTAGDTTWRVMHTCELSLQTTSKINVRPAHKTITVDDQKRVCDVEGIERVNRGFAMR